MTGRTSRTARRVALVGTVPSGQFPRDEFLAARSGTVLVSDYVSQQLQLVDAATIP